MNCRSRHRQIGLLLLASLVPLATGCQEQREILIIGHRGSPYEVIENSLAGFELAYMQGADGVELDVGYTRDDQMIIMHDETVDRTTNCKGAVAELSWTELSTCKLENGEPVRLLTDLLPDLATWFSMIFLEIKIPDGEVLSAARKEAFVDQIARLVKTSGLARKFVLISYDRTALERLATWQEQGIVTGWDAHDDLSVARAKKWGMAWSLMPVAEVSRSSGTIARGLSKEVAVYQVNSPRQVLEAEDAQVSAMMSDSVRSLCAMLGRPKKDKPNRQKDH